MRFLRSTIGTHRGNQGTRALNHKRRGRRKNEVGDTLIEILLAMLVIGIGATALLAGFGTAIGASAEHRSLATIDTVLKSFAETTKFQVQEQISPKFANCATTYTIASLPSPSAGAVGTAVTVFGTGFTPGDSMSVTVGSIPATFPSSAPIVSAAGNVTVTFLVPALTLGSSYPITLSDGVGGYTAISATSFLVTSGTPVTTSAISGYTLAITSIETWNATATPTPSFVLATCTPSGIQLVNLTVTAPNNVSDTLSFVVVNPAFVTQTFTPTVTIAITSTPTGDSVGSTLQFAATVSGPITGASPSGALSWTISAPSGSPTCASVNVTRGGLNSSTATCSVPNAVAGNYSITANYAGDSTYVAASGVGAVTVSGATVPTVNIAPGPASPAVGATLTFNATVSGPTGGAAPTGALSWTITPPSGTAPTCSTANVTVGTLNKSTASCSVSAAIVGTYSVVATYVGDSNYTGASGTASLIVGSSSPSVRATSSPASPTLGTTFTFKTTVTGPTGGPAPTGTITWSFIGPSSSTCSTTPLTPGASNVSTATCSVANASVGTYSVSPSYPGDGNYSAGSGSGTVAVGPATPAVSVGVAPASPTPGATVVFTATVVGPTGSPAPTGSMSWTISAPSGSPTCASANVTPGASNVSTATCSIPNAVLGTYSVIANYAGDANYSLSSGTGQVVVKNPPFTVLSVTSGNVAGGTAGLLQVGDTVSVTFSNPINPATVATTASMSVTSTSGTTISIPNLAQTSFVVNSTNPYVNHNGSGGTGSATATGSLALSANNTVITFTVASVNVSGGSSLAVGNSGTFSFQPSASIQDIYGQTDPSAFAAPGIQFF